MGDVVCNFDHRLYCLLCYGISWLFSIGNVGWNVLDYRGILFSRVKSETGLTEKEDVTSGEDERSGSYQSTERLTDEEPPTNESTRRKHDEEESGDIEKDKGVTRSGSEGTRRIIGIALAVAAGAFYGLTFVPVIYMIENPDQFPNHPMDPLPYVFSHYFGIFLTATAIFTGYAVMKQNRPLVPPYIVLPSLIAGILWAIATTSFFVANQYLSQAISFPIITMLPGCVVSAWSILYFHEIKGSRNLKILALAMVVTLIGAVMVGLSKFVHL